MKAIKFTLEKTDTFKDIHKKLLAIKGKSVINKRNEKEPFTIFNVGQIEEMQLEIMGIGFAKYLDGDSSYQTEDGTYNFNDMKVILMWGFQVEFGMQDKNGNTASQIYRCMIPKNSTYKKDSKAFLEEENHPFIFYQSRK